jgi:hypothetical protein
MDRFSRVLRHLMVGFMIAALGALGGQLAFSSQATAQTGCGLQECHFGSCHAGFNPTKCVLEDPDTGQPIACVTEWCDPATSPCGPQGCIE